MLQATPIPDTPALILTINSGSSSVKFSLYRMGATEEGVLDGEIDRIGLQSSLFRVVDRDGRRLAEEHRDLHDHDGAFELFFEWLRSHLNEGQLGAIGHRIVHGGALFVQPQIVTADVMGALVRLTPIAPDHLPHEVKAIRAARRHHPRLTQVVCFDTAFHCHMPTLAKMLPLPRFLWAEGVRRYGFHGLSYEYIMEELKKQNADEAKGRIIIAHLGNGASMAAVREGRSLETTMGFTPLGGLVMGTRPGDLDPGVILYLLQEKGLRPSTVSDLLNRSSGLLATSGITSDMKELVERETAEPHAAEAVDLFCYQAKKFVGALAAVLGGLDALLFTGGIGEKSPIVRGRICEGLEFLGINIDGAANGENRGVISGAGSRATVRVMKTNEDLMIARHTFNLVFRQAKDGADCT